MGCLWLVGSLTLQVSFAKKPCKRDYILQKRPIIFTSWYTTPSQRNILYDTFPWKCYDQETHQIEQLEFLGTNSNYNQISIWIWTARYWEIFVSTQYTPWHILLKMLHPRFTKLTTSNSAVQIHIKQNLNLILYHEILRNLSFSIFVGFRGCSVFRGKCHPQ
jgi:hypothetical protein